MRFKWATFSHRIPALLHLFKISQPLRSWSSHNLWSRMMQSYHTCATSLALTCCLITRTAIPMAFHVSIFNAKSVHNKFASIANTYTHILRISSSKLNVAAVVKRYDAHDSPDLVACCPPQYCYTAVARQRSSSQSTNMDVNHGGVFFFHQTSLKVSRLALISYASCEFLCVHTHHPSILFIVIY